jgi:hypothetical protein
MFTKNKIIFLTPLKFISGGNLGYGVGWYKIRRVGIAWRS